MLNKFSIVLTVLLLSASATADEVGSHDDLDWINAANDYLMPFEGAKSYAGSPAGEMLIDLWEKEPLALNQDHPAFGILEIVLPQVRDLISKSMRPVAITDRQVMEVAVSSKSLQSVLSAGSHAHQTSISPTEAGDLMLKSLPGFFTQGHDDHKSDH